MTTSLIDVSTLRTHLGTAHWRVADVRFDLGDPGKGEAAYRTAHLPGAIYAHLDRDLSDQTRVGLGRHPLPEATKFARWLSSIGYAPEQTWVLYDDGNAAFAARVWWMLRAIGHRDVRVLDGGHAAWVAAGSELTAELPQFAPTRVEVQYSDAAMVNFAELEALRTDATRRLFDARASVRYRGEVEPLDPVAGHVPGAINRPFSDNLEANGRFKSSHVLRQEWQALLGGIAPEQAVHMCGSGVTACHNLLAMELAGLSGSRLFPPSWSGWVSDPSRAVAQGEP